MRRERIDSANAISEFFIMACPFEILHRVGKLPKVGSGDLNVSNNNLSGSDLDPVIEALKADGNLNVINY